jgi:hypothetical protein
MENGTKSDQPKSFADLVRDRPELFDNQDCRPGPSGLDPEYSDSLIPVCVREKTLAVRRQRRAEVARASDTARAGRT